VRNDDEEKDLLTNSIRQRANCWPFPRHDVFELELRHRVASFFRNKGYQVQKKYPFILAEWKQWSSNIILSEVTDFINREKEERVNQRIGFPLHKYLHHGLSSQAMLFNLVGPLITRLDFEPIRKTILAKGIGWHGHNIRASFEVEDRKVFNEDQGQPTSIDIVVENDSDRSLFIEAKFVEREFGGCSVFHRGDCDGRNPSKSMSLCYLHHIGRKYWDLIKEYQILNQAWIDGPICPLASYYQFFRELLFALHHDGVFVLLYDARNPTFSCDGPDGTRGIFAFLVSMLPSNFRSRVIGITIQELFQAVCTDPIHADWVSEFAEKYGISCTGEIC
jgi:POLQ-like helicase